MPDFRLVADELAEDIASGRLRPGDRLPPQRDFAYRRGIAPSTAARVYAELVRRGLVSGETGRGTFVRAAPAPAGPILAEPASAPVDLELNFAVLPGQEAEMARLLASMARPAALGEALLPIGAVGTAAARHATARFLARGGWTPDPAQILFTGKGRHAIAAAFAALAPPGERVGVEALAYPLVKGIAARLGITLVPIALDGQGLRPDALARAHWQAPLRAVYMQPVLHNPLGIAMPPQRRAEIAAVLGATGLVAVEDAINAFLADEAPLTALAPDRVVLVDSLSKRVAPGMALGFVVPPPALVPTVAAAVRSGGWAASGLPLALGVRCMSDGTAERLATAKREDAAARQVLARAELQGLQVQADPRAYHLWLELPEPWRAEAYVAAAARRGIAVAPAGAFAMAQGHAPNAVRVALSAPGGDVLATALRVLRRLAESDPDTVAGIE
ncbi:aminotransferase-like domain-containing protein [Arenibaculum pallidiluteum]|uniref:aminotransferase-like domain-containing protein n=1 Tax=Arenibaculum pallidiluteum TaxID=2812559 RepID=UPI001A9769B1|nr:PLP-dependent aminotransferase family protein [Arenibaculum pallidiluteum]